MARIPTFLPAAAAALLLAATPARAEGLPQLTQTDTFVSQIFWLLVTFGALYYIMARLVLPRLGQVVEGRREKVDDDLGRAERMRAEAEEVMQAYEKALATAREEAGGILKVATDEIKAENTRRLEAFGREQGERNRREEAAIDEAVARATGDLAGMAGEAALAVTRKLIDVAPPAEAARAAVDQVLEGRR